MEITILCSSATHPVNGMLKAWSRCHAIRHQVSLVRDRADLKGGNLLFLISCNEILSDQDLALYAKAFVIHASDLPEGRGWSPQIWSIINGLDELTVTLLEATDSVDQGPIWKKIKLLIPDHALYDEINEALFGAEASLMDFALDQFDKYNPTGQDQHREASYNRKRTPADSELDPSKSISEQFDLLRVCDPERYPAFVRIRGHKYKLLLEKMDEDGTS